MTGHPTHTVTAHQNPTLRELWEALLARLSMLVRVTEQGTFSVEAFSEVERHLEYVPLAQVEYGLLRRRLENAKQYLRQGETGAARFELRLLARSLKGTARRWAPIRECVV